MDRTARINAINAPTFIFVSPRNRIVYGFAVHAQYNRNRLSFRNKNVAYRAICATQFIFLQVLAGDRHSVGFKVAEACILSSCKAGLLCVE
jgi:hypothetical protein